MANSAWFGRKPKLTAHQRAEAVRRTCRRRDPGGDCKELRGRRQHREQTKGGDVTSRASGHGHRQGARQRPRITYPCPLATLGQVGMANEDRAPKGGKGFDSP